MFDRACATDLWQTYEQLLEFNLFFVAWLAAFFLCPVRAQSFSRTVAKGFIFFPQTMTLVSVVLPVIFDLHLFPVNSENIHIMYFQYSLK